MVAKWSVGTVTKRHIRAITHNLKASYGPGITEELITTKVDELKEGTEPTDIIGMFVKRMLEEAGLIKEE
jgi:hypothetical protein